MSSSFLFHFCEVINVDLWSHWVLNFQHTRHAHTQRGRGRERGIESDSKRARQDRQTDRERERERERERKKERDRVGTDTKKYFQQNTDKIKYFSVKKTFSIF